MEHDEFGFLTFGVVLLAAAVLSVPIARRLGLSAIIAYLVAGIIIGPFGLAVFGTPESIRPVSELGVVMLLFLIGLELELGRLVAMRRAIFGLGAAQLAVTGLAIGALAYFAGLVEWRGAVIAGLALAMSATAIALQILEERGQLQHDYGQRAFAILLFQDMAVVPLLAALPLLAQGEAGPHASLADGLRAVALIAGAIALIVVAGRYLLNPFFRLLAQTGSREAMTAAALLVVLGAALLMQKSGMSMALGAFLAGVLLAESNYRHELEADIEPFRGLLLALFFMGIGMSIDVTVVLANLWLILAAAVVITRAEGGDRVALVSRHLRAPRRCAPRGIGAHRRRRVCLRAHPPRRIARRARCAPSQHRHGYCRHDDAPGTAGCHAHRCTAAPLCATGRTRTR